MKPPCSASSRSRKSSATESEPPERPISRRLPGGQSACRSMVDESADEELRQEPTAKPATSDRTLALAWDSSCELVPEGRLEPPTPRL